MYKQYIVLGHSKLYLSQTMLSGSAYFNDMYHYLIRYDLAISNVKVIDIIVVRVLILRHVRCEGGNCTCRLNLG